MNPQQKELVVQLKKSRKVYDVVLNQSLVEISYYGKMKIEKMPMKEAFEKLGKMI